MYQVIIVLDETRGRSYYYSYINSIDTTQGNITCDTLPPEQDISKAQAYYWDSESLTWVYDAEKYAEIVADIEKAERLRQEAEIMAASIPTNDELGEAVVELGDMLSLLSDAVSGIQEDIATIKSQIGGE